MSAVRSLQQALQPLDFLWLQVLGAMHQHLQHQRKHQRMEDDSSSSGSYVQQVDPVIQTGSDGRILRALVLPRRKLWVNHSPPTSSNHHPACRMQTAIDDIENACASIENMVARICKLDHSHPHCDHHIAVSFLHQHGSARGICFPALPVTSMYYNSETERNLLFVS